MTALRRRLARRAASALRLGLERNPERRRVLRWVLDNPDEECRYAYSLNTGDVVLDVGGFEGNWTDEIRRRYPTVSVHIFEPVPSFVALLQTRFANDPHVVVHGFGLSDRDGNQTIAEAADASSTFTGAGKTVTAEFRDVVGVFHQEHLEEVALMKINIEGGEFPLLDRMLESNFVPRVRNLQIQFHSFVANAAMRRNAIRLALRRTHHLTYDYEFVWENWTRGS